MEISMRIIFWSFEDFEDVLYVCSTNIYFQDKSIGFSGGIAFGAVGEPPILLKLKQKMKNDLADSN